jgi:tetratricopeptide (TPR) repeat protein
MKLRFYLLFITFALLLVYCNRKPSDSNAWVKEKFVNLGDSVDYVGMSTCLSCHKDVHDSYIQTGMGQSFDYATMEKSAASFGNHAVVYDKDLDFYYKPFFEDSILYILEYRLAGKDTTHKRLERVDYIIGSGHHTNSHMIDRNGYVYQAPITYYTQDKKWDLAPGFEEGLNSRFSRLIATECLTCHNHFPKHFEGSENKYKEMPKGIECERCHGPGSFHVQEKLKGKLVDTSKYADYSITNPRHLPRDLQMDLCQRCHLQGVAVLEDGKTFYDFKPGMALSEVMQVYLPRFSNSHERFIMASQADRMRLSPCYLKTESLSCISCHNPHHDVKSRTKNRYNETCLGCHSEAEKNFCSTPKPERELENDNCVGCHMPRSGSIDIPHITITDHNISKATAKRAGGREMSNEDKNEVARFLGLECLTKESPSPLEKAKGYLALYDKFMKEAHVLDSAAYYLGQSKASEEEQLSTKMHYLFAAEYYDEIARAANKLDPNSIADGWTAYRIGEAFYRRQQLQQAKAFFERATALRKYNLEFQEKLGVTYARLGQLTPAKEVFNFVLSENPDRPLVYANLGYMSAAEGKMDRAHYYYDKALKLDPDYETALMNKAALFMHQQEMMKAIELLQHLVEKHPDNLKAKQVLETLL